MSANPIRRKLCKTAGMTLTLIPFAMVMQQARASTNAAVRKELQYQGTPKGEQNCTTCLEFIPGKTAKDLGGCKVIPGDDEISPDGYCIRWNTM